VHLLARGLPATQAFSHEGTVRDHLLSASDRAMVTAALLTLDPATIGMLAAANMLTPDGRCKTLDAAAGGCASAGLLSRMPCMPAPAKALR